MKALREVMSWVGHIIFAVVIALFINIFVLQPTQVEGSSMESTLHDTDRVLINKLLHTFKREPDYGDIVVIDSRIQRPRTIKDDIIDTLKYNVFTYFIFDQTEEVYWIKRVIGKPGDVLEFEEGKVIRNGKVLEEPYVKGEVKYFSRKRVVVPENHIFVMGDNRNYSKDSRHIGCIPIDHIIGKYLIKF